MKVLVVDDDVVARKVLGAFLKQSNYEMQIVEDGLSAFRVLTADDAPPVAIVDWMMPDLSGPELCERVRKHRGSFCPYLIILSGRKEKADIVTALDSGADDFIAKPFNIQEMQARLRVAERSVERQLALCRRISELEQRGALPGSASRSPAEEAPAPPAPELRLTGAAALEPHQIDTVVASALRHCGLNYAPRRLKSSPEGAAIVAWASLLLLKEQTWVDLLLEMDRASLGSVWSRSREKAAPAATQLSACALALQTALCESLRSVLRGMGCEILAPFSPQSLSPGEGIAPDPADIISSQHYKLGDARLTFTLAAQPSPLQHKTAAQLQLFDILAQPYPPPDTHHVPLLRGGVVLKDNLIEKLDRFALEAADAPPVSVHRPSALALELHREPARSR